MLAPQGTVGLAPCSAANSRCLFRFYVYYVGVERVETVVGQTCERESIVNVHVDASEGT